MRIAWAAPSFHWTHHHLCGPAAFPLRPPLRVGRGQCLRPPGSQVVGSPLPRPYARFHREQRPSPTVKWVFVH